MLLVLGLLLGVQHQAEHVVTKLRIVQAHLAKVVFGLVPQHVAALRPEGGNGLADRGVVARRIGVNEARVGDLALGGRIDSVDLGVRQSLECLGDAGGQLAVVMLSRVGCRGTHGHVKSAGERVDAGMSE